MAQQYDHVSAQFDSIMSSFTNEYGFVVVRTAYADDEATDAAQWSTALAKLQELTLRSENNPLLDSHKFALPVIADPALKGASYDTVRTAFNAWVNHYEEERMWQSDRADGSMILRIPGSGDVPIPLVVPSDAGHFVKALTKLPAGTNLMAFGDRLTWSDYVKLWSKVTGVPATFEKTTVSEHSKLAPGGYGEEMAEMYAYAQDFGYDGSDPSVITVQELDFDVPVARIEQYIRNEDWSPLLLPKEA